jgi:hypothetical protein
MLKQYFAGIFSNSYYFIGDTSAASEEKAELLLPTETDKKSALRCKVVYMYHCADAQICFCIRLHYFAGAQYRFRIRLQHCLGAQCCFCIHQYHCADTQNNSAFTCTIVRNNSLVSGAFIRLLLSFIVLVINLEIEYEVRFPAFPD